MKKRKVSFYSEGVKLAGDIYVPGGLRGRQRRAGILLCHGYSGVKDLYLPDNARVLAEAGYVVMTFDYKGWGESEGTPRGRLAPYSRWLDATAALTFLQLQPEVDPERVGIYGTSYGGSLVVWMAAHDARVKATVGVVGAGEGKRWFRSVRRPDEWHDLLAMARRDREQRVLTGKSEMADRDLVLLPDRRSVELTAARRANPNLVNTVPLEQIDDTFSFNPEWVADRIRSPILFVATDDDRLVPPEETIAMHARVPGPKRLVVLQGSHYEVYSGRCFEELMAETVAWYRQYLPAKA